MNLANFTSAQLRKAASLKDKIAALQNELSKLIGASTTAKPAAQSAKRKMSAAGRERIRAAQKARWAKIKSAKTK